jgi:competence CoiA-like predicted nuclease
MNLRALLDGKDVILPLEDAQWNDLQQRLHSKEIELIMPCCKGQGYMRLSSAGTQHFVHYTDIGCKQSESEVHQLAKLEIVRACRELELEAIPEYAGEGWRADVLVKHPKWEATFEVQVSPQSFQETIQRQQAYKRDNVRCCWLFTSVPERQALSHEQLTLLSQYATPMFKLNYRAQATIPFTVEVNGINWPLKRFVHELLTKKLRYSQSSAMTGVKARVDLWRTYCPSCGYTMYFFGINDLQGKAECGAEITLAHNRYSLLYPDSYSAFLDRYVSGVPQELHEFLNLQRQMGLPYREFACTGCGKTRISEKPADRSRLKLLTSLAFTATPGSDVRVPLNHWCDNPCCSPVDGDSLGEIQDALSKADLDWKCTGIYDFNKTIDYKSKLPYRHYATYSGKV